MGFVWEKNLLLSRMRASCGVLRAAWQCCESRCGVCVRDVLIHEMYHTAG